MKKFKNPTTPDLTPKESIFESAKPTNEIVSLNLSKMIKRDKVAEYLGVKIQTVINYTKKGWLKAYKIGRRVLYNEEEVIAALQRCEVKRYQHESTHNYIFKR